MFKLLSIVKLSNEAQGLNIALQARLTRQVIADFSCKLNWTPEFWAEWLNWYFEHETYEILFSPDGQIVAYGFYRWVDEIPPGGFFKCNPSSNLLWIDMFKGDKKYWVQMALNFFDDYPGISGVGFERELKPNSDFTRELTAQEFKRMAMRN